MVVHSKLEVYSQDARKTDIEAFVLKKYSNAKAPLDIQILDQHGDYVTLDDDYLEEYNPFTIEQTDASTVQSVKLSERIVILRVTLSDDVLNSPASQQNMMTLNENSGTSASQSQQTGIAVNAMSIQELPKYPSLRLSENPKMGFIKCHNVNKTQRDQYVCDQVNVDTGKTTGTLSMIQGEKSSNNFKSILPQFSIWHDDFKNANGQIWTLLVFIVLDVCRAGKRSLLKHPQRTFVDKNNVKQQRNPYEIPVTTMARMQPIVVELKLTIVVIEGAKKHSNAPGDMICHLEDFDTNESFGSPSSYGASRLALVLRKGDVIQWETLVLSNEMTFQKRTTPPGKNPKSDVSLNPGSVSSKRGRSAKYQTSTNKRTKQSETRSQNKDLSVINVSTNPNDSSAIVDRSSTTPDDASQSTYVTSQTMLDIPTTCGDLSPDSTDIENLPQNSWDDIGISEYGFSLLPEIDIDENVLIDDDPLLSASADYRDDPPDL